MKLLNIVKVSTLILLLSSCKQKPICLEQRADNMSKNEMQSIFELLGHDLYEGRAPGTRGGDLAEIYMNSMFKFMDLQPETEAGFYQPFIMKGFTTKNVELTINKTKLNYIEDLVGAFTEEKASVSLSSKAVFVGFGTKADNWNWDDYKDTDVKDKIVVCRVNDPGMYNDDIFEGKILTYYGRWRYKIEEAAKRGASGILLIHTDESAGYDWNVVKNSWTGEELFLESDLKNNLKFRGWIKESSIASALKKNGIDLKELYKETTTREFKPVEFDLNFKLTATNKFRDVNNRNVVAEIPGKSNKRIVLSAHIDHLGKDGDKIYNGTIDNGTAVAAMMLTAKILKEYQDQLYYTVTILACNAEESGLLGSAYYVQNTNREEVIGNINFESTPVWEASKSLMGIGARFSDFEDIIKELAEKDGLGYTQFSLSNQGLFYRSDQFPFAKYGIPAVWISAGEDEVNGEINYTEFWGKDYHTVRDDYNQDWDLGGFKQTVKYALLMIDHMNRNKIEPQWKENLSFPMEK